MNFRHHVIQWIIIFPLFLSGCSLLEVKLDSQTTPLTQQELNMRLMTREYAHQFFSTVEQNADAVAEQTENKAKEQQANILLWKIRAEEGLQRSVYQSSPLAAFIDSWVFTQQMDDFFQATQAQPYFDGHMLPAAMSSLTQEFEHRARTLLGDERYQFTQTFVTTFAQAHAFSELNFIRTPAYRAWLKDNDIDETQVIATMGTVPEAMGDMSDRLSLMSEQTPKMLSWKTQRMAISSDINTEQLTKTLQSLEALSETFQQFVKNNPQYMQDLAQQMTAELQPLVKDIDQKTQRHMTQLSHEREALEVMVARERAELIQGVDQISQRIVVLAMNEVTRMIKNTLLYFILFVVAIFFAPLGLGYWFGKRSTSKSS